MQKILPVTIYILVCAVLFAQKQNDSIAGTWKGSSLCQVKPSPCHNETVVYHITANGKNAYEIVMNKIVDGKEEEMGIIPATFDEKRSELTGIMKGDPVWHFKVKGMAMEGTLALPNGTLYRIIHVAKQ